MINVVHRFNRAETAYMISDEELVEKGISTSTNYILVNQKSDFPEPVNGVITLVDNVTYVITTTVDLEGDRIVAGQNTTILGGSSENCRLKSTGLTDPLITSQYSLPMRSLTIEAAHALNLDGDGVNTALDWFGVNFTDCTTVGTVKDYSNFIMSDCAFLNSAGLTLDGTIGTVGFGTCLFDGRTGATTITLPETVVITRRFRIVYSSFVTLSGETAINVSTSATIPVEGYILDTVNFGGGGTYTTGVPFSDNKALFVECRGISNSAAVGHYTMNANATVTNIITQGVAVKIAGTTVGQSITQKFTHTNNRFTYIGAVARSFRVTSVASFTGGANDKIGFYISKNESLIINSETYATANAGGRAENTVCQTVVDLATNDFIEVWVENDTDSDDVTVTDLSLIVEALN